MKILIFNTFYYPKFVGGAEISVQLLAEELVKAGNSVYVITSGYKRSVNRINGVVVIRILQINVYSSFDGWDKHPFIKTLWHIIDSYNVFSYFKINHLLKRVNPQIVHTNNIQGFSPFLWALIKKKKLPLVHTLRDYYLLCHKCNLFNNNKNCETLCMPCKITSTIKSRLKKYPDQYIGISRYIAEKHRTDFGIDENKIRVVYNAVKEAEITYASHDLNEKLIFGFIGRLNEDKGVFYLSNEIAKLNLEEKGRLKLIFAGKAEQQKINQLGTILEGIETEFLGVVDPVQFYKKIDVLIVPSLWNEPFGRVVIESLSFGVPVCMSNSGGLKELHSPLCTWMFAPEENKLFQMLRNIAGHRDEILSKKQYAVSHASIYTTQNYVNAYQDIYSGYSYVDSKNTAEKL